MSYPFGVLQVGRIALREDYTGADGQWTTGTGVRQVTFTGSESTAVMTDAQATMLHDEILALPGTVVAITATNKTTLNGYYTVNVATAKIARYPSAVVRVDWQIQANFLGGFGDVDLESKTVRQVRGNDYSYLGEFWHAPPRGAVAYSTGNTVPSTVTRTSANGPILVYRNITTDPRYTVDPVNYLHGAVSLQVSGYTRAGDNIPNDPANWVLANDLVQVTYDATSTLSVAHWSGSAWHAKSYTIQTNGRTITPFSAISVLRNEPHQVIIRLEFDEQPGRTTLDLNLRRGSRFVGAYLQRTSATALSVVRKTAEAGTTVTGAIRATANDANGNRYVLGTARTPTSYDTVNGGLTLNAATVLDFFIGAEIGGTAAVAGDTAADLVQQYLGAPAEQVKVVRR